MSKFIISNARGGQFRLVLKAGNGETILTGETYTTKQSCRNGIDSVKRNAPVESNYRRLTATNGHNYFTLVAGNGEVLGTSEMYATSYGRDRGIDSVKENAPKAEVVDESLVNY